MKRLFVISGSSGVGKGTVIQELLTQTPEFKLSVSCTTRPKRQGEIDGINYHFINKEEFIRGIEAGDFLEWTEYSDNYYGTKKSFIKKSLEAGESVLLEIETRGAAQVKKLMPDAVLIFIAPPSFEELERRLRGRHTESESVIKKRLEQANREIKDSVNYDYVVTNRTIQETVKSIKKIILEAGAGD